MTTSNKSSKKAFYRDPDRGKVGGICAGIANYFGWEVWIVRIVAISALIFMSKPTFLAYVIVWIVAGKAPQQTVQKKRVLKETTTVENTPDGRSVEIKTRVWEAGEAPKDALKDIANRFQTMEHSLRNMERYVTSSEYRVRQEINNL